jgi:Cytidylate kinase-like family
MTNTTGAQIITMWELYGCGMEQIAARVAKELNLPIHGQAFSSRQVEESMAEREREGALGRFLRNLTPASLPGSSSGDGVIGQARTVEETARQVAADVDGFAAVGGVILGRNGAFLLNERPKALHVKLVGSVKVRVARAATLFGISEERSAKRQPLEDDFRRELALQYFKFDPTSDEYYDLVIDTTRFNEDQVVAIIVAAAKARAA